MNKTIICFCGLSTSGKDTAASFLIAKGFTKYSFATALKGVLSYVYDIPPEMWEVQTWKETSNSLLNNKTPRKVLQHVGTEGFRKIDPDVWLKKLIKEIDKYDKDIVITDARFNNEIINLKNKGAFIIYIDRPSITPNWYIQLTKIFGFNKFTQLITKLFNKKLGHDSEFYIPQLKKYADFVITNEGDLDLFSVRVYKLLEQININFNFKLYK